MSLIDKQKINYVIFHLNLTINLKDLESNFIFLPRTHAANYKYKNKIIFPLSEKPFNVNDSKTIDNIPILFPLSENNKFFCIDTRNNLIFNHDLITSSFYLLSGKQESNSELKDHFGRFQYNDSIQKKLSIIHKPIVNYYFDIITRGLKIWCKKNNLNIESKRLFKKFGFLLTHDVDRIDTFNFFEVGFKLKQLLGRATSNNTIGKKLSSFLYYLLNWINIFKKHNPHWDFDELRKIEKKYNYNSVFFFLQKDQLHQDSYYSFNDKRIRTLIESLNNDNCEIGLHGTVKSASSLDAMKNINTNLEYVSPQNILGIRQHRLIYSNSITTSIQEKAGLKYDSTLGFAEHEGFRNSFCLPFRVFDHENNRMSNIWEFPLIAMDTTLFIYRKLNVNESLKILNDIIQETIKFNGLFTVLWHNGFQVDCEIPKIEQFYDRLINAINKNGGENILGRDLLKKLLVN